MQSQRPMEPCMKPAAPQTSSGQKDLPVQTAEETIASDASKTKAQIDGKVEERLKPDAAEDCERERLKRHRSEMAGRVWIPETWGQEAFLKDWTADCTAFDKSLFPKGLRTAKEALVEECRRAKLRIRNRC